ncbi:Asparagine synthetase domain-containing protein 1, variant 2 [Schistosoma haematobium]|uniref:Asparagine synthetase domain-containing protein 1, variant 2 n=1 Tax=Schistosoma haematobium TaxID=6185 RepID=A0A922S1Z5_SCHHA|nr:Asparagine synthetase domain-containing protein 1, variant 2 [Schistosoma haematobium]KAH9590344.1 Asparagine synthetase domain-containing protein 1, variant 2 [Schistosoma haematobium]
MLSFGLFVSHCSENSEVRDLNAVELQDVLNTNISSTFYHTIETSYWKAARLSRGWISIFSSFFAFNDPFAKNAHQFLIQSNTGCNILFCSGQIRSSSDITLAKHFDSENISIGQVLLDAFSKEKNVNAVVNLINSLIGSFVLIFVSVESHRVYFTRDPFGRHSLVARKFSGLPSELFCIDSVSSIVIPSQSSFPEISLDSLEKDAKDWFEIPACGIFVSKIVCDNGNVFLSDINLYPWSEQHLLLCPSNIPFKVNRVLNVNQTHCNSLSTNMCIPTTLKEVQQKFLDLLSAVIHDSVNFDLLYDTNYSFNVSDVLDDNRSGSLFGLLFSGGLDSSVIAALLDRFVPDDQSIDLINVAFQRRCTGVSVNNSDCLDKDCLISAEEAPDRQTALKSYEELCKLSARRKWNLIKINVNVSEISEARVKHVWPLLLPEHTTVLDDSLGLALWFAARGKGVLHSSSEFEEKCTSSAKFLFLGSGIDEQLAGYARHLTTYKKFGPEALQNELLKEILFISNRNLGRDDRIISAHGRMPRLPYLDERIVNFLAKIPLEFKINPDLPKGQGEKFLLRQVASMLNLNYASKQPKRAMQFGSRVAKAEGSKRLIGSADQIKFAYQSESHK